MVGDSCLVNKGKKLIPLLTAIKFHFRVSNYAAKQDNGRLGGWVSLPRTFLLPLPGGSVRDIQMAGPTVWHTWRMGKQEQLTCSASTGHADADKDTHSEAGGALRETPIKSD